MFRRSEIDTTMATTVFLCGAVMTGRAIDQELGHVPPPARRRSCVSPFHRASRSWPISARNGPPGGGPSCDRLRSTIRVDGSTGGETTGTFLNGHRKVPSSPREGGSFFAPVGPHPLSALHRVEFLPGPSIDDGLNMRWRASRGLPGSAQAATLWAMEESLVMGDVTVAKVAPPCEHWHGRGFFVAWGTDRFNPMAD
jgi:hypothetical protein